MNPNRALKVALLLALVAAGLFAAWRNGSMRAGSAARANSFDECVALGNPIAESYPRQCRLGSRMFREYVGNELEKDNPSGLPEHADSLTIPVRFK